MNVREEAIQIFLAGVESVKPDHLIKQHVAINNGILKIKDLFFDLHDIQNIYVTGAGKASALMAQSMEEILGELITDGQIVTKYHHGLPLKHISITEAGHPIPDENSVAGTERVLTLANNAKEHDLFICLISGGGSALLTDVPDGCSIKDIAFLNELLIKSGADIVEMNIVRKHLSKVKGGHLAKAAYPAQVVSLILSDVIGDPLEFIASGPTVPDQSTYEDALAIIKKYSIDHKAPSNIMKYLLDGKKGTHPETVKPSDHFLTKTKNLILGNNELALKNAKAKAEALGYKVKIISSTLSGEISEVTSQISKSIIEARRQSEGGKVCLLFGGEPTVKVRGNGKGGRNQHLILSMLSFLGKHPEVTLLSCGTDGTDGPTDAAGAVADAKTYEKSMADGLDIQKFIDSNDSYTFFEKSRGLVKTGPTQTNVMDMVVVLMD